MSVIDHDKNNRVKYYLRGTINKLKKVKKNNYQEKYNNHTNKKYIDDRINYYNKLTTPTILTKYIKNKKLASFKRFSVYDLDLYEYSRYFNQNSIVLNLEKIRHFVFCK